MEAAPRTPGAALLHTARLLRRRAALVVLAAVAAALVAGASAAPRAPRYQGEARVLLLPRTPVGGADPAAPVALDDRDIQNQVEIIRSGPVRDAVQVSLGRAAPEVSVVPVAGSDVLAIRALDPDEASAAAAAEAYARAFLAGRRRQATEELTRADESLRRRLEAAYTELDRFDVAAAGAPADVAAARRQVLVDQQRALLQRIDRVALELATEDGDARLLSTAVAPEAAPGTAFTVAVAVALGLAAGLVLAALADSVERARRDERDGDPPPARRPTATVALATSEPADRTVSPVGLPGGDR